MSSNTNESEQPAAGGLLADFLDLEPFAKQVADGSISRTVFPSPALATGS
jgi:hypothetical protein